jgi:6-phosphofructokinase 1/ribokinase
MKFLAFFGHLNIDVTLSVPSLPSPGQATGVSAFKEKFAGTAGNFAYVANALGLKFDLYSAVGLLSHEKYLDNLKKVGISTSHVDIVQEENGPICYLPSDGKEQVAYMFQGPMNNWKASKNFEYGNYTFINIGTGPVKEYMKILGSENKAKVVFDPGQEIWYTYNKESANYMVNHSNMIIMNRKEFLHLLELLDTDMGSVYKTVNNIIITEGENGATLIENGESTPIPGIKPGHIADTIGAGDSFRAGLFTALSKGYTLKDSVKIGNITASKAIENNINEFNLNFQDILKIFNSIKS